MTRKDYELIAAAFRAAKQKIIDVENESSIEDLLDGADYVMGYLAEALSKDNSRFDADKFMGACHVAD